jgi:hypothetical protein
VQSADHRDGSIDKKAPLGRLMRSTPAQTPCPFSGAFYRALLLFRLTQTSLATLNPQINTQRNPVFFNHFHKEFL